MAYRQPVTKAEINRIRGVSSDHAVSRLVEYGLIREAGRLNAPGRPMLFATTQEFLRRFGMDSLEQLPETPEAEPTAGEAMESEQEKETPEAEPTAGEEESSDIDALMAELMGSDSLTSRPSEMEQWVEELLESADSEEE